MLQYIIFPFLLLLYSPEAESQVDCNIHKIYCKIKQLRPDMDYSEAMGLSNIIYKQSKKYNGDAILAVAIAMQETGIKERHRKQNIIKFFQNCEDSFCSESWKVIRGVSDICMFQFHVDTIVHHNIDPIKLKNDLNYCVYWHFKLMNKKKRICSHLDKPWSCYHSQTERYRKQYIRDVERYL